MAVTVVSDICRGALQDLGVLGAGEVMSAEDAALALERLNGLLDQYAAENLAIYTSTRTTWTLTANTQDFTLGPGGDINRARPVFITAVNFIDTAMDPDYEFPLREITEDDLTRITMKALTSNYPMGWYYNATYPLGVLSFYPIQTSGTLLGAIYAPTAIARYAALTTSFALPPGYERFLRTNLAIECSMPFEREPTPALVNAATESRATVKRANLKLNEMGIDQAALIGTQGRRYNIRQG